MNKKVEEEFGILELLEELRFDSSWLEDESTRNALCDKMVYFIIEN